MNFYHEFQNAVKINRMINMDFNPFSLIPNQYSYLQSCSDYNICNYLHLLGGGNVALNLPFSLTFAPIDCFMLLYTEKGGGRLTHTANSIMMTENKCLLLDCHHPFTLQSLVLPWNFKIFFFRGRDTELLSLPSRSVGELFTLGIYSPVCADLSALLRFPNEIGPYSLLSAHKILTNICFTLYASQLAPPEPSKHFLPKYLIELKDSLDHHSEEPFSLAACEQRFHINKYRICREFSEAFGDSPLRYLNHRRIERAKEMLLTTDYNIHEISSQIGYENINHFINLFKKNTGTTPKAFRLQAQEDQPVWHSPVQ